MSIIKRLFPFLIILALLDPTIRLSFYIFRGDYGGEVLNYTLLGLFIGIILGIPVVIAYVIWLMDGQKFEGQNQMLEMAIHIQNRSKSLILFLSIALMPIAIYCLVATKWLNSDL